MKTNLPYFRTRRWKKKKTGEIKVCYYYEPSKKEKPISLGTDLSEAIRKYGELHGVRVKVSPGTVADVYRQYLKWAEKLDVSGLSEVRIKNIKQYWGRPDSGRLQTVFGKLQIDTLRSSWMLKYFEQRSSQKCAKKELKFLGTMCNWARARDLMLAPNPMAGMARQMKIEEGRNTYVEDIWFQLVYKHGSQLVKDVMDFTYLCGNRPNESVSALKNNVKQGYLTIYMSKTSKSGNRSKRIEVAGDLEQYITRQRGKNPSSVYLVSDDTGRKVNPNGTRFRRPWDKARDSAEVEAKEKGIHFERFALMDIRAKAATDICEKHGLEAARLLLGHRTQKQTADYIRSIKGEKAQAVARKIEAA